MEKVSLDPNGGVVAMGTVADTDHGTCGDKLHFMVMEHGTAEPTIATEPKPVIGDVTGGPFRSSIVILSRDWTDLSSGHAQHGMCKIIYRGPVNSNNFSKNNYGDRREMRITSLLATSEDHEDVVPIYTSNTLAIRCQANGMWSYVFIQETVDGLIELDTKRPDAAGSYATCALDSGVHFSHVLVLGKNNDVVVYTVDVGCDRSPGKIESRKDGPGADRGATCTHDATHGARDETGHDTRDRDRRGSVYHHDCSTVRREVIVVHTGQDRVSTSPRVHVEPVSSHFNMSLDVVYSRHGDWIGIRNDTGMVFVNIETFDRVRVQGIPKREVPVFSDCGNTVCWFSYDDNYDNLKVCTQVLTYARLSGACASVNRGLIDRTAFDRNGTIAVTVRSHPQSVCIHKPSIQVPGSSGERVEDERRSSIADAAVSRTTIVASSTVFARNIGEEVDTLSLPHRLYRASSDIALDISNGGKYLWTLQEVSNSSGSAKSLSVYAIHRGQHTVLLSGAVACDATVTIQFYGEKTEYLAVLEKSPQKTEQSYFRWICLEKLTTDTSTVPCSETYIKKSISGAVSSFDQCVLVSRSKRRFACSWYKSDLHYVGVYDDADDDKTYTKCVLPITDQAGIERPGLFIVDDFVSLHKDDACNIVLSLQSVQSSQSQSIVVAAEQPIPSGVQKHRRLILHVANASDDAIHVAVLLDSVLSIVKFSRASTSLVTCVSKNVSTSWQLTKDAIRGGAILVVGEADGQADGYRVVNICTPHDVAAADTDGDTTWFPLAPSRSMDFAYDTVSSLLFVNRISRSSASTVQYHKWPMTDSTPASSGEDFAPTDADGESTPMNAPDKRSSKSSHESDNADGAVGRNQSENYTVSRATRESAAFVASTGNPDQDVRESRTQAHLQMGHPIVATSRMHSTHALALFDGDKRLTATSLFAARGPDHYALSTNHRFLVTADASRAGVTIFELSNGALVEVEVAYTTDHVRAKQGVQRLAISANSTLIAAVSEENELVVVYLTVGSGRKVTAVPSSPCPVNDLSGIDDIRFARDNKILFIAGGGHLKIFQVDIGDSVAVRACQMVDGTTVNQSVTTVDTNPGYLVMNPAQRCPPTVIKHPKENKIAILQAFEAPGGPVPRMCEYSIDDSPMATMTSTGVSDANAQGIAFDPVTESFFTLQEGHLFFFEGTRSYTLRLQYNNILIFEGRRDAASVERILAGVPGVFAGFYPKRKLLVTLAGAQARAHVFAVHNMARMMYSHPHRDKVILSVEKQNGIVIVTETFNGMTARRCVCPTLSDTESMRSAAFNSVTEVTNQPGMLCLRTGDKNFKVVDAELQQKATFALDKHTFCTDFTIQFYHPGIVIVRHTHVQAHLFIGSGSNDVTLDATDVSVSALSQPLTERNVVLLARQHVISDNVHVQWITPHGVQGSCTPSASQVPTSVGDVQKCVLNTPPVTPQDDPTNTSPPRVQPTAFILPIAVDTAHPQPLSFFATDDDTSCFLVAVARLSTTENADGSALRTLHVFRLHLEPLRPASARDDRRESTADHLYKSYTLTIHNVGVVNDYHWHMGLIAHAHSWQFSVANSYLCYRSMEGVRALKLNGSSPPEELDISHHAGQVYFSLERACVAVVAANNTVSLAKVGERVRNIQMHTYSKRDTMARQSRVSAGTVQSLDDPTLNTVQNVCWLEHKGDTLAALVLSSREVHVYKHSSTNPGWPFQLLISLSNVVIDKTGDAWQPVWCIKADRCLLAIKGVRTHRHEVVLFDLDNSRPTATLCKVDNKRVIVKVGFLGKDEKEPTPWLVHSERAIDHHPGNSAILSTLAILTRATHNQM